jgi:ribonuclease BN (tRNA processing enzyme)
MARLIFLGTAGSLPVVAKQFRSSGGIILQVEDLQFHIDPGPGALVEAKKCGVNLHNTTAVLVSHNHLNHCNDLNAVIDAMTHSGIEHRGIILASKSILHNRDNSHPYLTQHHKKLVEKIIPMEKNHKVGVELVEINALPNKHTDSTAIGFKFFCPKFTLSYTGDTLLSDELIDRLVGTDILILNVPYPGKEGQGLNLDTDSAIQIVSKVRPRLAILTHFGLDMIRVDPLQEARDIQRITGIQTIAAQDGLAISPSGYGEYKGPVKGYQ